METGLATTKRPQAIVRGDLSDPLGLAGQAGTAPFRTGGPDGVGGANPYELLSASLAACTAMTIRFQARRKRIPLVHVDVAVSFHHAGEGERDQFERAITLVGDLDATQRAALLRAADLCPVGKTLGQSADIVTLPLGTPRSRSDLADYLEDLNELAIPNVDAD